MITVVQHSITIECVLLLLLFGKRMHIHIVFSKETISNKVLLILLVDAVAIQIDIAIVVVVYGVVVVVVVVVVMVQRT